MVVSALEGGLIRSDGKDFAVVTYAHADFRLSHLMAMAKTEELRYVITKTYHKQWDLYDVSYLPKQKRWLLLFVQDLRLQQCVAVEKSFARLSTFIRRKWDENYIISGMTYGDSKFLIVMSRGGILESESKARILQLESVAKLREACQKAWNEEKLILSELVYAEKEGWVAVLTSNKSYQGYQLYDLGSGVSLQNPSASETLLAIQERNERIRAFTQGENRWIVVTATPEPTDVDSVQETIAVSSSWDGAVEHFDHSAVSETGKPSLGMCLSILQKVAEENENGIVDQQTLFETTLREVVDATENERLSGSSRGLGKKNKRRSGNPERASCAIM